MPKCLENVKRSANLSKLLENNSCAYYWIGFLLADGTINHETMRLKLTLAKKDLSHVERFHKFIQSSQNISLNTVSCQDKLTVPKIIDKFDLKKRKTYNPPEKQLELDINLMALYIGFIDGDGSIKKVHKRKDCNIIIKVHSSWLNWICDMESNIYSYLKINKFHKKSNVKINKQGYALLSISDSRVVCGLKKIAVGNKLPILSRKWDLIDIDFISKYEVAKKRREEVCLMYNNGMSFNEISNSTDLKYTTVYQIIKRIKNEK